MVYVLPLSAVVILGEEGVDSTLGSPEAATGHAFVATFGAT